MTQGGPMPCGTPNIEGLEQDAGAVWDYPPPARAIIDTCETSVEKHRLLSNLSVSVIAGHEGVSG